MRQTKRTPTPPTAEERDAHARTYSYTLDGTIVSLTRAALKQLAIHRRDALSASRNERRRMAAILRDDRLQARINKAIQRQLDRQEKRSPPRKIRVSVEKQNRRKYNRKQRRVSSKAIVPLPTYESPILDKRGRRGIVMVIDYDGAKRHAFGIIGRRIVYISDPEHCELDPLGRSVFFSNMGADLDEILMGADLLELTQRESRADAKTNVNIIIQLPHDVPQEVRAEILKAVAHELFGRHGLAYAASLHRPDPDGDQRNFHGHICGSWRPMSRTEAYGWEIAQDYRADLDGGAYWRHARRRVAEIMTATLERSGTERHYTHLSNAERGLPHKPQKKLDKRKTRTAREGDFVADVEANRRTIEANLRLERALKAKREERRKRALKRRLSALARVELAVRSPLNLRPVAHVEVGADRASIAPVSGMTDRQLGLSLGRVEAPQERSPIASIALVDVAPIAPQTLLGPVVMQSGKWRGTRLVKPVDGRIESAPKMTIEAVLPSSGASISQGITAVAPTPSPPPALAPVSTASKPTIQLQPVAPLPSPRAPLRPANGAADIDIILRPVAAIAPDLNAPGSSRLSPVRPPIRAPQILRRAAALSAHPPVIARVAASTVKDWPSLRPVASDSATPRSLAGLLPLQPVKPASDLETRLRAVGLPGSGPGPGLRRVEPSRARERAMIRAVSPSRAMPAIEPVSTPVRTGKTGLPLVLKSVGLPREARIDSTLAKTMRTFGERLERIAQELSAKRSQGAPTSQLPGKKEAVPAARNPAGDASAALRGEIDTARAFVARVKDKAIHVGIDEDGLVLPQPIYWRGNRLTRRGLSDPAVQAELVRMEQRQADYMRHIHQVLRETLTDKQLRNGTKAILDALPEKEREQARAWATTGIWPKLLLRVTAENERRSRRDLGRWRAARNKADGSQFALAAEAARQLERWPLDLSADGRKALEQDASQHLARLAMQQARAHSQEIT